MLAVSLSVFALAIGLARTAQAQPKYVIFLIGDGMGPEQMKAAGIYANGEPGTLSFESLPHKGELTTYSAGGNITDSAAAGTALATGMKAGNGIDGVISGADWISSRVKVPAGSDSFWVRIQGATIPAETRIHSSGWVLSNSGPIPKSISIGPELVQILMPLRHKLHRLGQCQNGLSNGSVLPASPAISAIGKTRL